MVGLLSKISVNSFSFNAYPFIHLSHSFELKYEPSVEVVSRGQKIRKLEYKMQCQSILVPKN